MQLFGGRFIVAQLVAIFHMLPMVYEKEWHIIACIKYRAVTSLSDGWQYIPNLVNSVPIINP